jgi:hypothetical protein
MIRYEIVRLSLPTIVGNESTEQDVRDHLRALHKGGAFARPHRFVEARLYDRDTYFAWVLNGGTQPNPIKTLRTF